MSHQKKYKFLKELLLFACAITLTIATRGQKGEEEANLKAAFIYNFTKYVEWDSASARDNFVIAVLGSSPVEESLRDIAKVSSVNNKKIVIRHIDKPDEIPDCQILFIPDNNSFPLESILDKAGKGVLTVSEQAGYARRGTTFNFIIVHDKLKFEASLKAIYSAGLKVSSQLLKLATIVD